MDFTQLEETYKGSGQTYTPYAGKDGAGNWVEGSLSIQFLIKHFGGLNKEQIYTKAKTSEGLTLYFEWLDEQGTLV